MLSFDHLNYANEGVLSIRKREFPLAYVIYLHVAWSFEAYLFPNTRSRTFVASMSLGRELDLQAILLALPEAEFEPERFPGLIYRVKDPKAALLLFGSGKVVCTGAKSFEQVKTVISKAIENLKKAGISGSRNPRSRSRT